MLNNCSKKLYDISSNFNIQGTFLSGKPYGSGHINDTFVVTFRKFDKNIRYLYQKVNSNVFPNSKVLMNNISCITSHLYKKAIIAGDINAFRTCLQLVPVDNGQNFYIDLDNNLWRVFNFIENSKTYDIVENDTQVFEAGKAFGKFQRELIDLPGKCIQQTISDFHNTKKRYENLKIAIKNNICNRAIYCIKEIEFAITYKNIVSVIVDSISNGKIPERIVHNDTKLNNVLLDKETGKGLCVIDLDTVMQGSILYDFGDLVRTSTTYAAEDEKELSKVSIQIDLFEALICGYLSEVNSFITPLERNLLVLASKLMTFENGIRFLTDFLNNDIYFKTHYKNQNLQRTQVQFKLVQSIENNEVHMMKIIDKYR